MRFPFIVPSPCPIRSILNCIVNIILIDRLMYSLSYTVCVCSRYCSRLRSSNSFGVWWRLELRYNVLAQNNKTTSSSIHCFVALCIVGCFGLLAAILGLTLFGQREVTAASSVLRGSYLRPLSQWGTWSTDYPLDKQNHRISRIRTGVQCPD